MSKKMCKSIDEKTSHTEINYECTKCHQKAKKEKHLCKPKMITGKESSLVEGFFKV